MAGMKLMHYEIHDQALPIQPFQDVKVTLELRNANGDTVSHKVAYQVSLGPMPAILRSEP
ncbi:MAG: hypothetical protein AB7O59_00500 [Pirellulales bacterium]